jgi:outer membrane lipoprotein-sorting protein
MRRSYLAIVLLAAVAAVLAPAAAFAAAGEPDFKAMLKAIDEMADFGKQDYSAVYSIVSEKPGENPSTTQVKIFRRDQNDQIVILIQKPEKQRGQGYLKIDDNVWFFDPESGNYSHSTMKENINNTEAKNSDFKRYTFSEDYELEKTERTKLGAFDAWILSLKAKNNEVSYQKIRLTVRADKPIPLKEEDYSLSDRLMRTTLYLPTYVQAGGKLIPAKIKMVDEINKGKQSVLSISDVVVAKLTDSVFTKTFLERAQ